MNIFKRSVSLLLALVLVLSLGTPAYAVSGPRMELEVSSQSIEATKTVEVTIKAYDIPKVFAMGFELHANNRIFETVSIDTNWSVSDQLAEKGYIRIATFDMTGDNLVVPEVIATVTLRATEDVEAADIWIEMQEAAYMDETMVDIAAPEKISIEVTPHTHSYTETVVAPTCTEKGYTLSTCTCGDSEKSKYTDALGHNYADGVCTRCGEAGTAIPEGAKFTDMLTDKGEIVTVTEKDGYYLVEVPYGTTSLMVTYPEDLPKVDEFSYVTTRMSGFDGVSQDGYGFTRKDGKIIVGLALEKIDGMTVTVKDGKIHVERYGTDLTVGNTALTLTFKALTTGETNVKVTSAKVDISEAALTQDAPDASVIDNVTKVSVTGFTVSLPTEFKGESSVLPGENYTFEAKDKNYNYAFEGSTMNGQTVSIKDNGDGTFTIENVTGDIVILTQPTGKTFTVTLGEDMTSTAANAQYMTAYTATLTKVAGYNYNVTVTIGGQKFTGFSYDAATGLVTIPGEAITGEIVFNSNKTAKTPDKHSVEFAGEYGDIAEGTLMEVENGTDYVLTINKVLGYKYTVTATMGGEPVEVKDNGDGTYTIKNVTGDLVITIAKEYDLTVEVAEYVKLNGKAMFLVTATGSVDEGKILAYDGTAMFWSEQYNAWSYLVITEGTLSVEDAKAKITLNEGEKVELAQTYNINESASGTVDINDAQLVFDMYNNKYQDFDNATMQKFLKADVNGDKAINVNDAAAVVSVIVENKNK